MRRQPQPAASPSDGVERVYPLGGAAMRCCRSATSWRSAPRSGPETERLIDARRLGLMKRSAFLVNIARGAIVDEDALYRGAARRYDRRARAIDVWWQYPNAAEPERRPSRHPFHELPNVIMTPHCSGWTAGMVRRRWDEVAGNINPLCARRDADQCRDDNLGDMRSHASSRVRPPAARDDDSQQPETERGEG